MQGNGDDQAPTPERENISGCGNKLGWTCEIVRHVVSQREQLADQLKLGAPSCQLRSPTRAASISLRSA